MEIFKLCATPAHTESATPLRCGGFAVVGQNYKEPYPTLPVGRSVDARIRVYIHHQRAVVNQHRMQLQ
jgi:hypothetical protein